MKKLLFSLFFITYLIGNISLYSFEKRCSLCEESFFCFSKIMGVQKNYKQLIEELNLCKCKVSSFQSIYYLKIHEEDELLDDGTRYAWYERWDEEEDDVLDLKIIWRGLDSKNFTLKHRWEIPDKNFFNSIVGYSKEEEFYVWDFFDCNRAFSAIKDDIIQIYKIKENYYKRCVEENQKHIKLIKSCGYDYLFDEDNNYKSIERVVKDIQGSLYWEKRSLAYAKKYRDRDLDKLYGCQGKVDALFSQIYQQCIDEKHQWLGVYYQRGIINFNNGNIFEVLQDIEELIENSENLEDFLSRIYLLKGQSEVELGLYHDAIASLYIALREDPKNKEAYFERAQAYFELGEFDKAISDFLETGLKSETINPEDFSSLLFAKGLIFGVLRGGKDGAIEFVPSALASLQGLSNGLWAFVTNPENCSKEIVAASRSFIEFMIDSSSVEIIKGLVPELGELIGNWGTISDEKKGDLMGYVIGKYGIDILITTGSIKAFQAYRNLKRANNLFTLEKLSMNTEVILKKSLKKHEKVEIAKKSLDLSKINPKIYIQLEKQYLKD
ncbi:hypothetical protein LCGC14_2270270, partial [marine sediment metagenome]